MNPLLIFSLFKLVPYVVAGIEQIHTDASGATKKQLAEEALGLAVGTAEQTLPGSAQTVSTVGAAVSTLIDQSVSIFNALGMFTHKKPPAPAVVPPALGAVSSKASA